MVPGEREASRASTALGEDGNGRQRSGREARQPLVLGDESLRRPPPLSGCPPSVRTANSRPTPWRSCKAGITRASRRGGGCSTPRVPCPCRSRPKCHPRGRCKTRPVIDLLRFVSGLAADLVRRRVELVA